MNTEVEAEKGKAKKYKQRAKGRKEKVNGGELGGWGVIN